MFSGNCLRALFVHSCNCLSFPCLHILNIHMSFRTHTGSLSAMSVDGFGTMFDKTADGKGESKSEAGGQAASGERDKDKDGFSVPKSRKNVWDADISAEDERLKHELSCIKKVCFVLAVCCSPVCAVYFAPVSCSGLVPVKVANGLCLSRLRAYCCVS